MDTRLAGAKLAQSRRRGLRESFERQIAATAFVNSSGYFRVKIGFRSKVAQRFRDIALLGEAVNLFLYWGISRQTVLTKGERRSLNYLESWTRELGTILGCQVCLHFVFTDTHARINDLNDRQITEYIKMMEGLLAERELTYSYCRMSELLPRGRAYFTGAKWEDAPDQDWAALLIQEAENAGSGVLERTRRILVQQAHALGYGERASIKAMQYLLQNIYEAAFIGKARGRDIMIDYGLPELDWILPSVPKLHAYVASNTTKKPWFHVS